MVFIIIFKSYTILRIRWLNYGKERIVLSSFEVFCPRLQQIPSLCLRASQNSCSRRQKMCVLRIIQWLPSSYVLKVLKCSTDGDFHLRE